MQPYGLIKMEGEATNPKLYINQGKR